jgi:hypothetical protein
MADDVDAGRPRRRYERVTGPFDGLLSGPVLVYDLNLGGCFINTSHHVPGGTILVLRINLPNEDWITVNAEALYSLQHGFAVRFPELDSDTSARIARTVEAMKDRRGF